MEWCGAKTRDGTPCQSPPVQGRRPCRLHGGLKQRPRTDLATQSGPMLVINGRVHPRFDKRSTSLKARNGVGVRTDGKVLFAISKGEVSFEIDGETIA
jgi:uncharacterized protein YigE (DUF2233 family)